MKELDKNTVYLLFYRRRDKRYVQKLVYTGYFTGHRQWEVSDRARCRRRRIYMLYRLFDGFRYAIERNKEFKLLKGREAIAAREQALKENKPR